MHECAIDRGEVRPHTGSPSAAPRPAAPAVGRTGALARVREALRSALADDAYLTPVAPTLRDYPYPVARRGR